MMYEDYLFNSPCNRDVNGCNVPDYNNNTAITNESGCV